jgi:RNA polymerase sigma-70 factor, ECF subfamily
MMELVLTVEEILALNAGDHKVYTRVYEYYVDWLSYYVYRRIEDKAAAEDIVQEVMIKILEKCATLHSVEDIQRFIFSITRNKIIDFVRWRDVRRKNAGDVAFLLKSQDDTLGVGNMLDTNANLFPELLAFIETLPPDERDTITLIFISGVSHKEAAELLDKNKNTITKLKTSAIEKMRRFLLSKGFGLMWIVLQNIFGIF